MKKLLAAAVVLVAVYLAGPWLLTRAGEFLVVEDDAIEPADAVVVLSTGVDYLPRLIQAAELHRAGLASTVVINGNRKTDIHRRLERQGFVPPVGWHEEPVAVLAFLGVDRDRVIAVDAEDAYDTLSEAGLVGRALEETDIRKIIVTTSKFHTRRAFAIWRYLYPEGFDLQIVGAGEDPFAPDGWWRDGRQVRQLLSEYGAWLYFWGKRLWQ